MKAGQRTVGQMEPSRPPAVCDVCMYICTHNFSNEENKSEGR